MRVPNDEAITRSAPRNDVVGRRVFNHIERFGEKRRRTHIVQPFHWLRREVGSRRRRRRRSSTSIRHCFFRFNSYSIHFMSFSFGLRCCVCDVIFKIFYPKIETVSGSECLIVWVGE